MLPYLQPYLTHPILAGKMSTTVKGTPNNSHVPVGHDTSTLQYQKPSEPCQGMLPSDRASLGGGHGVQWASRVVAKTTNHSRLAID